MNPESLRGLLEKHAFFKDLSPEYLDLIVGCASNVRWDAGDLIFREGQPADHFYLVRFGRASVEAFVPGRGSLSVQTVQPGEVLGWAWLIPPYLSHHDVRAVELTRAVAFDGACLRGKCEDDPRLGFELMRRCAEVVAKRLLSTQMQLLDVYGHAEVS